MSAIRFQLRPDIDTDALAHSFARERRVRISDVLTAETAATVLHMLQQATPWGLAWQAGAGAASQLKSAEFRALQPADRGQIDAQIDAAAQQGQYAFRYGTYPMLDAYREQWAAGGPHDWLFEHLNDQPFLDLVRRVTAMPELRKADAQATIYAPGHFLSCHDDSHVAQGWKIAYVLSMTAQDWKPEWGGYLNFLDDDGDVVAGWRPRFNTLSLFAVPQSHQVTYVPPFAPYARFAITGWFRDQ